MFSELTSAVRAEVAFMWAMLSGFISGRLDEADMPQGTGPVVRAKQAGTVIAVVVIGVVALVGLLIFGEVYAAMPLDQAVFSTGGALEGTLTPSSVGSRTRSDSSRLFSSSCWPAS